MVSVRKRGKVYEYRIEIASIDGTRKWLTKSGFKTKQEALHEGALAYNEYYYYGKKNKNRDMSFADYLDYWIDNYCNFNLKYATIVTYLNIIKVHLKPKLGMYKLSQIDSELIQNFINQLYVEHSYSKCYLKGILKTIKNRFTMAVKIRLQRHGKKNFAFFHIVVADTRAPRDGRYIEQIGSYNPNTNPASIVLNSERALAWLKVGAEPTLVARRILSYEGVLLRNHLDGGVAKGALTQEQADQKWNAWKAQRDAKIAAKKDGLAKDAASKAKAALDAEKKVNAERAEAIAKKAEELAKAAEEAAAAKAAEEAAAAEGAEAPAEA